MRGKGIDYSQMYFTIESMEDGNVVRIININCNTLPTFYYSTDSGETWNSIEAAKSQTKAVVTIDGGKTVMFKCTQSALATAWNQYNGFLCSKNYIVYGNAMSLIRGDDFISNSEFVENTGMNLTALFRNDINIIDASNLILPAMTAPYFCYNGMFRGCINLKKAPQLPAINFTIYSAREGGSNYSSMFEGCINLEEAPELPATNLVKYCYHRMFCMNRSTSIKTPKMTKSPILPAPILNAESYEEMFKGNGNLVEVTCLATNISATDIIGGNRAATYEWLAGCSDTGTFKKAANMTSWLSGTSGIPSGWTVEDYTE